MAHIVFMKLPLVSTSPNICVIIMGHLQDHVSMSTFDCDGSSPRTAGAGANGSRSDGAVDPMMAQQQMQQHLR